MSEGTGAAGNEGGSQQGANENNSGGNGGAGSADQVLADLHDERKKRQAAEARASEFETRLSQFEEQNKTEQEKALEKARKDGRDEASNEILSKANARILKTEVRRLAAEKFADPSDPINALDLSQFSVDDNGDVDEKAISTALDRLLAQKPHWGKESAGRSRTGSADQGARGAATSNADMNALLRGAAGIH